VVTRDVLGNETGITFLRSSNPVRVLRGPDEFTFELTRRHGVTFQATPTGFTTQPVLS
jgi:hypothetical protein